MLHQLVVIVVWNLSTFASPDNKLRRIGKIATRNIGRWIRLSPSYHIQNFITQLGKTIGNTKYIMVCTRNPNGTIVFQFLPAKREPLHVKLIDFLLRHALVPVALVNANHLAALYADTST